MHEIYEILDSLPEWQCILLGTFLGCCIGLWLCKLGDATLAYIDKIRKKAKLRESNNRLMYSSSGMSCRFLMPNLLRYYDLLSNCKDDTIILKTRERLLAMKDNDSCVW